MSNGGNIMNGAHIISDTGVVTIIFDGQAYTIQSDHKNYDGIKDALNEGDYTEAVNLIDISSKIDISLKSVQFVRGMIKIVGGVLYYGDHAVDNSMADRILKMQEEGFDVNPILAFLDNLMKNPSYRAVQETYGFLEASSLPLTEDGCFLAYKRVRDDYMDWYSNSIDNSVGQIVTMPRNMVDEDKNRACSSGLHFCSLGYLSSFHAYEGKIVILKIDPQDVVSIPIDYNNSKGRCCRYEVIAEYTGDDPAKAFAHSVYSSDGGEYEPDGYDDCECDEDYCDGCGYSHHDCECGSW